MSRTKQRVRWVKNSTEYVKLWRIVDGALLDCVKNHPDYFVPARLRAMRLSVLKRVVGAINGSVSKDTEGRR